VTTDASIPRFSDGEYERRHRILRDAMDERGLDCLLLAGSPGYMSGGYGAFWVSGYPERIGVVSYVVFPREGAATLLIPFAGSHVESAKRVSFIQDVRHSNHGDYAGVIVGRLEELGLGTARIGITELDARYGIGVPHEVLSGLRARLPEAEIEVVAGLLEPIWMVQSTEEIGAIETASLICDEVLGVLSEKVRPGVHDYELRAIVASAIMERRAELAFTMLGSTSMSDPSFAFPYALESDREIRDGDVVITEFGARYLGYEGQTGRPLTLGRPTREFRDIWGVAVEGARVLEDALRPGVTADEIRLAGKRHFEQAGYVISAPMLHTLGICNSAPVIFLDSVTGDPGFVFEPGVVVSLQSNPATEDRSKGLFVGNDYVVTESGCRRLNNWPFEMIEIC
jgi:Xaa-Pro aminopeptidase